MEEHRIDLSSLTPHGKVKMKRVEEGLDVWTTHSITPTAMNLYGDSFKAHRVSLPGKYRLPLRIDIAARLDFPALLLFIGSGHISFATPWRDNRKMEDIAKPSGKPNQDNGLYDNRLPLGELVDISVLYNTGEMQILIGGEQRFYSRGQPYMKMKDFDALNGEGFTIGLAVSKLSTLRIKAITVTESDDNFPIIPGASEKTEPGSAGERPKPTFDSLISELPQAFRDEILEMDSFLKSLRPLKFKRTVDKNGSKITYVASDFGISYAVNVSGTESSHQFGWYMIHNGKPETWHTKADRLEETLAEIAKSDPALSERVFYALNDCVGCYGSRCLVKRLYTYNGQKRLTCHGRVVMRMRREDFEDVRAFFGRLNAAI